MTSQVWQRLRIPPVVFCVGTCHIQQNTTLFWQSCTGTSHSPCVCVCVCLCVITFSTITILQSHLVCEFLIQAAKFLFFFFTPCFFRWLSPANSTSHTQTDLIVYVWKWMNASLTVSYWATVFQMLWIIGPKMDKVIEEWWRQHNMELYDLYSSLNII